MMHRAEWEAMVARVRKHYGPSVEVGGFISGDIVRLQKLAAQADTEQENARAAQPLIDAATRLHHTRERVHRARRAITEAQAVLKKNRRLHEINGAPAEFFEKPDLPRWESPASTVDAHDAANAETAALATEWETRAQKMVSYVSTWERSTLEQQNRMLILALAERLDRLERK
ncbi:hypothetical protein [Bradyrhizobium sp. STM 3562]|uniref:hypothetical protein n=1 Tax=Bradyrhizobium sp. STM 3562 TaxID=578924 RepID=UPI00388FBE4E